MTKVLLVRVSSLGDVVQTFPAVSDVARFRPELEVHWAVEEAYVDLVRMHPAVRKTHAFALRRWRKRWWSPSVWHELSALRGGIAGEGFDRAIDSQGLAKSLWLARAANAPIHGFGPRTVREPWVARFYDSTCECSKDEHRVWHYKRLMASAFDYEMPSEIDYGLRAPSREDWMPAEPYCVLLHGTARDEKLWPERNWIGLGLELRRLGLRIVLPWGNADEAARSQRIAQQVEGALVAPKLSIPSAAALMNAARAVVGVDTGLMHLAVALKRPVVGLYLATRPGDHGPLGAGPTTFRGGPGVVPGSDEAIEALSALPGVFA